MTDGTFTVSIEDADASDGSFSANTNCVVGTAPAIDSSNDEQVHAFDIDTRKCERFGKVVVTASGAPATGGRFGVVVAKAKTELT